MSTNRRSAPHDRDVSGRVYAANFDRTDGGQAAFADGRQPGAPGGSRKKRRRQRSQRGKRRHPVQGGRAPQTEAGNRERIFQDIEGLLRQIREQAEESPAWTEEELRAITQTVTSFTKSLEEEVDPVSERARSEYQRVREKLSQALRGERNGL